MIRTIERKIGVLVALAGAFGWTATGSAQGGIDRSVPWIVYAAEIGGAPAILQLDQNGFTATDDLWQFANTCVPERHTISSGRGRWRFVRGTRRQSIRARTLHVSPDTGGHMDFEWEAETVRSNGRSRFHGTATIRYYATFEHLVAGQAACVAEGIPIRGIEYPNLNF